MTLIRIGAVNYLNARPLVYGLDRQAARFSLRFDTPSRCANLLHEGAIDVGLIPSIEYAHRFDVHIPRSDYHVVSDVGIMSVGAVASVALFTSRPTSAIRSVAVDRSSRASAALLRVLCAQWFDIEPKFVTLSPDLGAMLKRCDAALIIGDVALFADYESDGLEKIDLGEEWTAMTSLPFVWAFWAGRPNAIGSDDIRALQTARDEGVAVRDTVASAYYPNDEQKVKRAEQYLRENIKYNLDEQAWLGFRKFLDLATDLGIVRSNRGVQFY